MIFQSPELPEPYLRVVEKIDDLRKRLQSATSDNLNRWTGYLARMSYARLIHGSNTMEGINATLEDAAAAVDGEEPLKPSDENWLALRGHRDAMDYVIQLSKEPSFTHNEGTILALHFMMMKHDLSKFPGRYRPGPIRVENSVTHETVYEGPESTAVPRLMNELVGCLNNKNPTEHVIIRAAMAHLNLTMIHPFKDGNGRMARALQTFVLARDRILDPRFSSIEEYVGRHSLAYYDVLADVGKGAWHPDHDCLQWIKFCLRAHFFQARTLMKRVQETSIFWELLEAELGRRKLPERSIDALAKAAFGHRVRNDNYRKLADVSMQVAMRDLKTLVGVGLLQPHGERRGRSYLATPELRKLYLSSKSTENFEDPFDEVGARSTPGAQP
jgi:Fic family protein